MYGRPAELIVRRAFIMQPDGIETEGKIDENTGEMDCKIDVMSKKQIIRSQQVDKSTFSVVT